MLRDTDGDWNVIAADQPYFGVLANERYLLQNLSADANKLARVLSPNGIGTVMLQHTDHGGCHGAWIFGVKG